MWTADRTGLMAASLTQRLQRQNIWSDCVPQSVAVGLTSEPWQNTVLADDEVLHVILRMQPVGKSISQEAVFNGKSAVTSFPQIIKKISLCSPYLFFPVTLVVRVLSFPLLFSPFHFAPLRSKTP